MPMGLVPIQKMLIWGPASIKDQVEVQVRNTLHRDSTKTLASSMVVGTGDRRVRSLERLNIVNPITFMCYTAP